MNKFNHTNRRQFVKSLGLLSGAVLLSGSPFEAFAKDPRYQIAVIDLMILKRQKLSAFQLAKDIGADGLEVDMGGLGNRETFDSKFKLLENRQDWLAKSRELDIKICSLAMTGFYAQSFAERPTYKKMLADCLLSCQQMGIKTAFLPLGITNDLVKYPELRPASVERLKGAGEMAKRAGVVIGIETALDAAGDKALLKEIGSKNIKIYFNFSNPLKEGRDLCDELRILGKKNICMIHCTDEDGVWLEHNTRLDMPKVKETLDRMGWKGWLVIERSRDARFPTAVLKNFTANTAYMKKVFQ